MTDQSLREALEQMARTAGSVQGPFGAPFQAVPSGHLLDLLAAHPAEPAPKRLREALEAVLNEHEVAQADTPKFNRAVLDDLIAAAQEPAPIVDPPAELHAAGGKGITVGELIEFLRQHDPALPVATACGCRGKGGWSSSAQCAYLASGTATSNKPHLKIGWGGDDA